MKNCIFPVLLLAVSSCGGSGSSVDNSGNPAPIVASDSAEPQSPTPEPAPQPAPEPAPEPVPELAALALTGVWDIPMFECRAWEDPANTWFWAFDDNLRLLDPNRMIVGDWSQVADSVDIVNQNSERNEWRRENGRTLTITWGTCLLVNGPELPIQDAGLIVSEGEVFRPTKIQWESSDFNNTRWSCGDYQWLDDFSGVDFDGRRGSETGLTFYADGTGFVGVEGLVVEPDVTWTMRDGILYYSYTDTLIPPNETSWRLTSHDGFYWQVDPTQIRLIDSPGEYGPGYVCDGPFVVE